MADEALNEAAEEEAEAAFERLGLDPDADDEGDNCLANMPQTVAWITDKTKRPAARFKMAEQLQLLFYKMDQDKSRAWITKSATLWLDAIFDILKEPDDKFDAKDHWGYDKGLQRCGLNMMQVVEFLIATAEDDVMVQALLAAVGPFAEKVAASGIDMRPVKPGKPEGPSAVRLEVVSGVIGFGPKDSFAGPSGKGTAIPPDYIQGLLTLISAPCTASLPTLRQRVSGILMMISVGGGNNTQVLYPHAQKIFDAIRAGNDDLSGALSTIMTTDTNFYRETQAVFDNNLDVVVAWPMMQSGAALQAVVNGGSGAKLLPHVDTLVGKALTDNSDHGDGLMCFNLLKELASVPGGAAAFKKHVDPLFEKSKKTAWTAYAMGGILAQVAQLDEASAVDSVNKLFVFLELPSCQAQASSFLMDLKSAGHKLSQEKKEAIIGPKMATIKQIGATNSAAGPMVDMFCDWYAGRSLESLENRVDAIEEAITAMNGKISKTCGNFEDVVKYIDSNMAEMKEFLATVAKKLPQPQKLSVIGRVRKTLRLHFICPRSGKELSIESYEWNKWLKVAFSVIKVGKCVLDIGTDNPLGIVKAGVEGVKDIYNAYKSNDEAEFNKYIREPFLTSKEQDKLIEQLRAEGFFDIFFYDAQAAAWCHNDSMTAADREAVDARAAPGKAATVERTEGTYLGEARGAAAAGVRALQALGAEEKAEEVGADAMDATKDRWGWLCCMSNARSEEP